ncbi:MAG: GTP-binding protein [Eubacteriales bacterium]|nr:GTP-binding protein [Eubacteriales bacterium]
MINLILLTGFLGSGKTTLLNSLLHNFENKRIGVIVNEFGKVNIDAVLTNRDGIEMAELSNGSIFCACLKGSFIKSLVSMSKCDIDHIFVEASGLADPANMAQILSAISGQAERTIDYLGSVCVVDAENHIKLFDVFPALQRQIEYSSVLIINKSDLVDQNRILELSKHLISLNPDARQYVTTYCRLDLTELIKLLSPVSLPAKDSSNTIENRPMVITLSFKDSVKESELNCFLKDIAVYTYRIKGFVTTEKGLCEISAVGQRFTVRPFEGKVEHHEIVLISSVGIKLMSLVTEANGKFLNGRLSI